MTENLSRKTFGNAAILLLGTGLETVLQFVFVLVTSRQLGPVEFGFFGYVISLVTFAQVLANFGLTVVAVREITQRPGAETALFAAAFRIRAALSLLLFAAAFVYALAAPLDPLSRSAIWLAFAYLLFVPFDLAFVFDAHKQSRWEVPGKLAGRLVSLGLLFGLWQWRGRLTIADAALCSSLLLLVNVAIGWHMARRLGMSLKPLAPTRETGRLLTLSLPLVWSNLVMTMYTQSQTVLVKWLSTAVETGWYALSSRLILPVIIFKAIVYRLLLPILSEVGQDRATMTARLEKILPALSLIFMPVVALGIPASELLIVPLFGPEYAGAVRPFQISLSLLYFTGLASLFGTAVLAAGDARTSTIGLTIGAAVSVLLSLWLIPSSGAVGAAWAAWWGEAVGVLYTIPKFLRWFRPRVGRRLLGIALASGTGMAAVYGLQRLLPPGVAVAIGGGVVLAGLGLAGEITRSRLQALRAMLPQPGSH